MSRKTVLITGANGFIGQNLRAAFERKKETEVLCIGSTEDPAELELALERADVIYHLAGVNRPKEISDFETGNREATKHLVDILEKLERTPRIVFSSSTQAILDNPYGKSKKDAEDILLNFGKKTGATIHIFRLTNVFGKWSRPNYNSVVSTFCYNISHNLPITISNPDHVVDLVYIDDVVRAFIDVIEDDTTGFVETSPTCSSTLSELAEQIYALRDIRSSLIIPDLSDDFTKKLYATYLSYLDSTDFAYDLDVKTDNRGALAELIKSEHFGQMFVSRTHGKIMRGNHYHDTKIEKFCVLMGDAMIRFRHLYSNEVIEYQVSGADWKVVDIPPGYTHHIENLSDQEMVVLFWADEMFDANRPDTYFLEV